MTDIDIANKADIKPITEIAAKIGLTPDDLEQYGKYKAKIPLSFIDKSKYEKSNLILVTAISPTPAGEGKTTVSIGLTQAMNKINRLTTVVLREPSLGPVFGIKGGAAGGGYSQVIPMEDINLHFTGDFSAIEKANNLLAALIDNNINSKDRSLGIDPRTVVWKRVMDMNDRSLRHIVTSLGGTGNGIPREAGFDITAASEVMAILCMCENRDDLKRRLGNIFIGFTFGKKPVYAKDINAQGAMATLLKDSIKPNLVQTLEGGPAIIHGGPFANIAQGTNTIIATKMGLSLSPNVVTEAGFGADLGAQKFLDIKCVAAGLKPKAVVLVATVRAMKYHGGILVKDLNNTNVEALKAGLVNLDKHIENVQGYNIPVVVAVNRFPSDTDAETQAIVDHCKAKNVKAEVITIWADGGDGALNLAKSVGEALDSGAADFTPLYDWSAPVKDKIEKIAKTIYGADAVEYSAKATLNLRKITRLGLDHLPICMAKTQKSLSDNPKLRGRPTGFNITVREIEIAAGAEFLIPITGAMMRMPGLPNIPASEHIDIDNEGNITGLS